MGENFAEITATLTNELPPAAAATASTSTSAS